MSKPRADAPPRRIDICKALCDENLRIARRIATLDGAIPAAVNLAIA
jgi:hypothetical protein